MEKINHDSYMWMLLSDQQFAVCMMLLYKMHEVIITFTAQEHFIV